MEEKKYKRTTVTAALPYANGGVHIGHLAGVYVPSDIYVRYLRLKKQEVIFIGGSDEHGVPVYSFLASIKDTECKDVFVIAGNHDSPSLLSAPKEVLNMINIHVYATKEDIEPYVLDDKVVILPIPFPRDQELRRLEDGESIKEEDDRLRLAIEELYKRETEKTAALHPSLPIVAMGHLMATNITA